MKAVSRLPTQIRSMSDSQQLIQVHVGMEDGTASPRGVVGFFTMPRELRDKVYDYYFDGFYTTGYLDHAGTFSE